MTEDPGYEVFFVMQNRIDGTSPTLTKNFGDTFYYIEKDAINARNDLIKSFCESGMEAEQAEKTVGVYKGIITITERN